MKTYNLDNLRIHELRELARQLNINSPTSKRRDVLVRLIKRAQSGTLPEKYKLKNNKGRPLKSGSLIDITDSTPLLKSIYNELSLIKKQFEILMEKIEKSINS